MTERKPLTEDDLNERFKEIRESLPLTFSDFLRPGEIGNQGAIDVHKHTVVGLRVLQSYYRSMYLEINRSGNNTHRFRAYESSLQELGEQLARTFETHYGPLNPEIRQKIVERPEFSFIFERTRLNPNGDANELPYNPKLLPDLFDVIDANQKVLDERLGEANKLDGIKPNITVINNLSDLSDEEIERIFGKKEREQ